MGQGRRSVREVELVDDDEVPVVVTGTLGGPPGTPDTPGGPGGPGTAGHDDRSGPPAWARRLRPWWPVGAGLALVLVAGQLVLDARERAELARFADLPGVLRPLEPPLAVRPFSGPLPSGAVISGFDVAGLRVTSGADATLQSRGMVAYDPGSGEEVWRTTFARDGAGWVHPGCGAASGELLICLVEPIDEFGALVTTGRPTRVVALRGEDGEEVWSKEVPSGTQLDVEDDLAVIAYRPQGEAPGTDGAPGSVPDERPAAIVRLDVTTGVPLWEYAASGLESTEMPDEPTVFPWVTGGRAIVWTSGGSFVLDRDGHVVAAVTAGLYQPTRTDWLFRMDVHRQLIDPDGGTTVDAAGDLVGIGVDDGSAPEMVFLSGSKLSAVDTSADRVAWAAPEAGAVTSAVVLDDVLYGLGSRGLDARDARTGAERWHVDVAPSMEKGFVLSTDGRDLYLLEEQEGATVLSAFDRSDGHRSWSWPVPDDVESLWAFEGRLWSGAQGSDRTAFDVVE